MRPRILLADDHPTVLKATNALLKAQFDIVGNAIDGPTLVAEALRLCPDVIVADITLPVFSVELIFWRYKRPLSDKRTFVRLLPNDLGGIANRD